MTENPYYSTNLWTRFKAHFTLWRLKRRIAKIQKARWAQLDERLAHGEWFNIAENDSVWLGKPGGYCPLNSQPMTPEQEQQAVKNRGYLTADPYEQISKVKKNP